ncbi:MAG: hypothetical protein FWD49_02235 [Firmicutes bacterium]|nr:hypothetical protein [Bacillota bacterium]
MQKCLLLINTKSGNSKKVLCSKAIFETLKGIYGEVDELRINETDNNFDIRAHSKGYSALAVCGGDGTFNNALNSLRGLNVELLYIPCGTLNDSAHTLKSIGEIEDIENRRMRNVDLGEFNDTLFSYVTATGTFTPIGYIPKPKHKKFLKKLTYYLYAFKFYKVEKIKARLTIDSAREESGEYTLIMAVKSRFVFGFGFNKAYSHNSGTGHLLLINTPKGLFKSVKLFFRFFRAFFIGFKKEYHKKHIRFTEFSTLEIKLNSATDFCVDGEKVQSKLINQVKFHQKAGKIYIL